MCGEVSTGTQNEDKRWRSFFAARGSGGWRGFVPQNEVEGWRIVVNPTDNTLADEKACDAERHAAAESTPPSPTPDLLRRCPIESAIFWIDYNMACAGHTPPD